MTHRVQCHIEPPRSFNKRWDISEVLVSNITCDSTDGFESVWRKVLDNFEVVHEVERVGFGNASREVTGSAAELADRPVTPDVVRRVLARLGAKSFLIVIIDEFDRLNQKARRAFADAIKTLSDHAVGATVVLVGVADSVEQLLKEHASVERALVQVHMPRMSENEIASILRKGVDTLGMTIESAAIQRIIRLSQGLPHYAHLLGLYASRAALDDQQLTVPEAAVDRAIVKAIDGAQQSIRNAYDFSVTSPRKLNLFSDVLLACAMATRPNGFFQAQDVRPPLRRITGRNYDIPNFAQHLSEFTSDTRGNILHKIGAPRRYRYRFSNPLMQPYVIMQGARKGRIDLSRSDP